VLAALAPAQAVVTGASIAGGAGTVSVGGTLYAKSGATVTVTVTTDISTKCVAVGSQVQNPQTTRTTWTFSFTAGATEGPVSLGVRGANGNNDHCKDDPATSTVGYVVDNTGPVLTPTITPAANAAGWNRTAATVSWTAADPAAGAVGGSGVLGAPGSTTISTEGSSQVTATWADRLGNSTTTSTTVKLDATAPSIVGSRAPGANSFGWNNVPVTVSFGCADSGSGIKSCTGAQTVTTDGANQSRTGTAIDNADNPTSTTVSGISIDRVPPALAGVATTPPTDAGWYHASPTIHWTATDALSGIDTATVPGDQVLAGEGSAVTISGSVADLAGNTTTATSAPVKIDRTPPVTSVTAPSGWTNTNAIVTLTGADGLSGVAATHYSLDGGPIQTGTSLTVSTEGTHDLAFWSDDVAGNTETHRSAQIQVDKTAPTITHEFDLVPTHGWFRSPVKVTFTCLDNLGGSGVASCTGPVTVATQGSGQDVPGSATDLAGNGATDHASVSLDSTPPSIIGTAGGTANGNGWYGQPVIVSFSCSDSLSGVDTCAAPVTVGEGQDQSASGTAYDVAGNSATALVTHLDVDLTRPDLAGAPTTPANAHGWYDNSVTVHWTCGDNLSGLDGPCPADTLVSGEGADLSASASVSDEAGNTRTTTVDGIGIDTTPPVTTASVPDPLATGWYPGAVLVTLHGVDALSHVETTHYAIDGGPAHLYDGPFSFHQGGIHTLTFWSVDNAGNVEDSSSPGQTLTVKIDDVPPTIAGSRSPGANAFGWNNGDVTVHFDCSDAESAVLACTADHTLTEEGADQSVIGHAEDQAGNQAQTTVDQISIDTTPPSLAGAPTEDPNSYDWYRHDVTVHWTPTDALSGIDPTTIPADSVVTGEGDDLTTGVTHVTDQAGNVGMGEVSGLRIDRTPPTLAGTPDRAPNSAGWYNAPVTISWAANDDRSGVPAGTVPADSLLSGEGEHLSTGVQTVADRAGNTTSASVDDVRIDQTAPHTAVSAPSDWVNSTATVTLTPSDNLSQVAATYYTIGLGPVQTGTGITFNHEGVYDMQAWSVDIAGNVEAPLAFQVRIDETAPVIGHSLAPEPNAAGWNRADVTVTFTCSDDLSGIASCTTPQTVTIEGKDQPVPGTAVDHAGNSATDPVTVSLDKTPPTIVGSASDTPNNQHWFNHDVTVSFSCDDGLSGVASCSGPATVGEGADQSVEGSASDAADNSAHTTVGNLDIDETPPTMQGSVPPPNAAGWYRNDVQVTWTCDDLLSGIAAAACPAPSAVTGEGSSLSATESVQDRADNSASATVGGLHIDRTPPVTTLDAPSPVTADGWYAGPVQLSLETAPDLAGVTATWYAVDGGPAQPYSGPFTYSDSGTHTLSWWSADAAGNVEDSSQLDNSQQLRIDDQAPTIVASRLPLHGNAAGWNNEPVVIHFECADSQSGLADCPADVTVVDDGAAQSVTRSAVDAVGHTASTTLGDLNVDRTPPSLSGAPVEAPNAHGWYRDTVHVHWTCSDATSGIHGTCPGDSAILGEGSDLGASADVTDNADNLTSASVTGIAIDRTPPTTTISAPNMWVNDAVTVTLSPYDGLSDVDTTHYRVDGGALQDGVQFTLGSEGVHEVDFWSVDNAGNVETEHHATIRIDRTRPSISASQSPAKNANGWNNTDVTVSFECDDDLSGVASCSAAQVLDAEGADQPATGHATDVAGNTAETTTQVSIDKTPPTISAHVDRAPNAHHWYDANVFVDFTCHDDLSGTSCPGRVELSEGAGQSVDGDATDLAGNAAHAHLGGLSIDKTAPTLTGAPTVAANAEGWYRNDVVVHWTCGDELSGLDGACPGNSLVAGEGSGLSASALVHDLAGNQTLATVTPINIDRTGPTTTATAPAPYATGWYDGPITVTLNAADALSGVATMKYAVDAGPPSTYTGPFVYATPGVHTLTFWSVDRAGNVEDRTSTGHAIELRVDDRRPTITGAATTPPNAAGWYNAPVQVAFSCADVETGIASCGPDRTLSSSGAGQSVTGVAVDRAGNTAQTTVSGINIDRVLPSLSVTGVVNGAAYTLGAVPIPGCVAADDLSGVAGSCTGSMTGGVANGVGFFTYTASVVDRAGNQRTATATWQVTYRWDGFLQPVADTAHSTGPGTASFNAGSTVPVKFQLLNQAGQVVTPTFAPQWITPVRGSGVSTALASISYSDPVTVGGSYAWDGDKWKFNWSSPKAGAGYYWRIGVRLDDGTVRYVNAALR